MRDGLTEDLLNNETVSYSELINVAQRQLAAVSVAFKLGDSEKSILYCNGEEVKKLEHYELALYLWFLQAHRHNPNHRLRFTTDVQTLKHRDAFADLYKTLSNESKTHEKIQTMPAAQFRKHFREARSRLASKLKAQMGKPQAKFYEIQSFRTPKGTEYGLSERLEPHNIEITRS